MKKTVKNVSVVDWGQIESAAPLCELLVIATGFEDRALEVLRRLSQSGIKRVALIRFLSGAVVNDRSFVEAERFLKKGKVDRYTVADLDIAKPQDFEQQMLSKCNELKMSETGDVWVDISSLPTYAICIVLKAIRELYPRSRIKIFYTEAVEYYPTRTEYRRYSQNYGGKGLEALPCALTTEMRENLILTSFGGFSIRQDKTCLFLFVGFEKHRSLGAIESMNPSKLVVIYGDPGKKQLKWRYDLSKELHENLVAEVERAEEVVSTLDPDQSIELLDSYYEMLYDDYTICITPINSKMQTVACYLIWEKYRDIQLSFPIPISYMPDRFSKGSGNVYSYNLPMLPGVDAVYGSL